MKSRILLFLVVFTLLICSIIYLQSEHSVASKATVKKEVTTTIQKPAIDSVKPSAAVNIGYID